MSTTQTTLAFERSRAKGAARLVLLAMADEANTDGELTAYKRSQSALAKKTLLTERSVRRAIDELIDLGEVVIVKEGDGRKSADYKLTIGQDVPPGRTLCQGSEDRMSPLPGQDVPPIIPVSPGLSPVPPSADPSVRRSQHESPLDILARETAVAYYDWHKEENQGPPAQKVPALIAIAKACLKLDYPADEILDAMKLERRAMSKQTVVDRMGYMRREREQRPSTAGIPSEVVKAFVAAKPWFTERWPEFWDTHKVAAMEDVAHLVRFGYGVGEAMIRLAIGMRQPAFREAFWLINVDVPRFPGGLADYPSSMNAAYRNQGWRV